MTAKQYYIKTLKFDINKLSDKNKNMLSSYYLEGIFFTKEELEKMK